MSQPIPGIAPSMLGECTVMVVWPSLASRSDGRMFGQVFANNALAGVLPFNITLGKLLAFACIPLIVPLYFFTVLPRIPLIVVGWVNPWCIRYRLTNRRVVVEQPFGGGEQKSVSLDHFDSISIEILPGQQWYRAGDLVFRQGQIETFRLSGVSRPETFRQTCLKAQKSYSGVAQARALGFAV
jgi:hypothetical protein